jgi:hypothetical protein
MLYHVTRSGQNYGPYTVEDLQKYIDSGNILPSDLAKSDDMADWVPVSQILGVAPQPAAPGFISPMSGQPVAPIAVYPDPPNLHWALVLLIGMFTCGIFTIVWIFIQATWMRRVDPCSKALFYYIGAVVLYIVGFAAQTALRAAELRGSVSHGSFVAFSIVWILAYAALFITAKFSLRNSIEKHFNGPEPIGISLSGVMTFFFSVFYFQYHFSRINQLKQMARYRGAAV